MAKNNIQYEEIAKAEVSATRNVVISSCSKGGFTIAQQLVAKEDAKKDTIVYLKGAFHIDNIDGLYNIRDALNAAIQAIEEGPEVEETWDDE